MADKITRIAIVDSNRCKPKRCAQECKKVGLRTQLFGAEVCLPSAHLVLPGRKNGFVPIPKYSVSGRTDDP